MWEGIRSKAFEKNDRKGGDGVRVLDHYVNLEEEKP